MIRFPDIDHRIITSLTKLTTNYTNDYYIDPSHTIAIDLSDLMSNTIHKDNYFHIRGLLRRVNPTNTWVSVTPIHRRLTQYKTVDMNNDMNLGDNNSDIGSTQIIAIGEQFDIKPTPQGQYASNIPVHRAFIDSNIKLQLLLSATHVDARTINYILFIVNGNHCV